ncbi:MAG: type I methionyl aminopeptidase [Planctomycetaceae bacterium]|nr:type I methionyl aminopeptidase [Planctomycetaceae bacterium]
MITLKSRREIERMRVAGGLVAQAHQLARSLIAPGVTTAEIDAALEQLFAQHSAIPLFKGFPGEVPFPAVTCISVNEAIVHGIPGTYRLQPGDIVSIDTGCKVNGWCGDAAWTYPVGVVDDEKQRLMAAGERILEVAIQALGTEKRWSGVARQMMREARSAGFSLVEQFVGHGIGQEMHEPPQVPNYTSASVKGEDFELRPGLVLAIEPMVNAGVPDIRILADHWTAVTADGRPSVHFEHTVALTNQGPEILTAGVGK